MIDTQVSCHAHLKLNTDYIEEQMQTPGSIEASPDETRLATVFTVQNQFTVSGFLMQVSLRACCSFSLTVRCSYT